MADQNPFARIFNRPASLARLAVLNAGQRSEPLKIHLVSADQADAKYDCVSYDRSKDVGSAEVEVDGVSVPLPIPLEKALRGLRRPDSARTLWADLLIGNTAEERSAQAAELQNVFKHSENVIAWLGLEDANHDAAVEVLRNLANRWKQACLHTNFPEYSNRATQKQMMSAHAFLTSKPTDDLQLSNTALWQALQEIFSSTYFETTQSIPEIILAKSAVVAVGEQSITWEDFNAALTAYLMFAPSIGTELTPKFLDSYQRISRLELATLRKRNGDSLELLAMLKDARRTSCSDPREMVFSLLPIITPCERTKLLSWRPSPPQVDYSKTVTEVFKEACKYVIEERQDTMLWLGERPPCGRRVAGLPSWASDFSTSLPLDDAYNMQRPNNGLRAWADPLQNKKIYVDSNDGLHVQAHPIDRIIWVSERFTEENCRRLCLEEWQKLPALPNEPLADRVAKMWRTLCLNNGGGMTATVNDINTPPADLWISFQSVLAEERIMSLLNCTLQEAIQPTPEIIARARSNPDIQVLGPQTGKSQPFEDLLRTRALGRRFFQTETGRVGMTAIEDVPPGPPPPPPAEGAAEPSAPASAPAPNFDQVLANPLGQSMLHHFQNHLAQENPDMARVLAQALNGELPGQRAPGVRSGDLVVALVGGFQPYVLRPQAGGDEAAAAAAAAGKGGAALQAEEKYAYVGDCYVHGVMEGECLKEKAMWGWTTRYRADIEKVDIVIV